MRTVFRVSLVVAGLLLLPFSGRADDRLTIGDDAFTSGANAILSEPVARDGIVSGFTAEISGKTERDALAAGFDVDIDAPVGEDLYAAGFSVKIEQPVGEDVTASAFNIHIRREASVGGNVRIAAGSITLDAPISGSVIAAGGTIALNGLVSGDARLTAGELKFGPEARIQGNLTYYAPEPIEIAPDVVAPERVHFEPLRGAMDTINDTVEDSMPGFWPPFLGVFLGFLLVIGFLLLTAAVLFALTEDTVEGLRQETIHAPFRSMAFGMLSLSTLTGLIPVAAATLVGLPLIPVILLAIVALWIAGYLLGVYVLAWSVGSGFWNLPSGLPVRLSVIAIGLVVAAMLNFVPVLGWLINLAILFLGLGGIAARIFRRLADARAGSAISPGREPGAASASTA